MHRLLLFAFAFTISGFSQTSVQDLLEKRTLKQIEAVASAMDGVLGFAAIDLTTGHTISFNGNTVFPQASSIKIPIMIQVFRDIRQGKLKMDQPITISPTEVVDSSERFEAAAKSSGKMTVLQLVEAMIEVSDNAATNKLIQLVGMANVNRSTEALQLPQTRLQRKMIDVAAAARNEENVSTPLEMATLAAKLYRGEVVDKAASAEMLEIMSRVKADMRAAIPPAIRVAAKPGQLTGVLCETGVVYLDKRPFALSVAGTFLALDKSPVPDVTKIIFHHFEMIARSNKFGRGLQ